MGDALSQANSRVLRLSVGFLLKEGVGFSRDFDFEEAEARLADDLAVVNLAGRVTLTRTPQGLYADGRLRGKLASECSRCLTPFLQPVTVRIAELYHYPPETAPREALAVSDSAHLDLAPLAREDFLVSKPMVTLCRPDCKGLCPQCGQDWNTGPCDCQDDAVDPRLAPLAALLKEKTPDA